MILYSLGKGRKHGIATIFWLLIAFVLLSGGFFSASPSRCLVSAQNDKKNGQNNKENGNKNNDKNNNDNNGKNKDTESPTMEPTRDPTAEPTEEPTLNPTEEPTDVPSHSPVSTRPTLQARLPEIDIDITTVVDDIFSFAALLLDSDNTEISITNGSNNKNGLNAYFESFVLDLLIASEAISASLIDSVDVKVKFLPLEQAPLTTRQAPDGIPVRIAINGMMKYLLDEGETMGDTDALQLEDKISHILEVYFTFWSTDAMRASLSQYGLTEPHITAVRVDDKLILVEGTVTDTAGDLTGDIANDNTLVSPTKSTDPIKINDSIALTAGTPREKSTLFSLAVSTIGVLIVAILS